MENYRQAIPLPIKQFARKNSFFGCVYCGRMHVEYHHVSEYAIVHQHQADNIVLLCPNCHAKVHGHEITDKMLKKAIENPYNKKHHMASQELYLGEFTDVMFKLASVTFRGIANILAVDQRRLIWITSNEANDCILNADFLDENGEQVARVRDNVLTADTDLPNWDVIYQPGHLIIKSGKRKISLELSTRDDVIEIRTRIHFQGGVFDSLNSKDGFIVKSGESKVTINRLKFYNLEPDNNNQAAIHINTGEGGIRLTGSIRT